MSNSRSLAKVNRLERDIGKAEADAERFAVDTAQALSAAEAGRWEQAEEVWRKLKLGGGIMTQQEVAAGWVNRKTGKPYSQAHVNHVAQVWDRFGQKYKPAYKVSFEEAYRRVQVTPNPAKPPRKPRTPKPKDAHQSRAARAPKGELPSDPQVIAWVKARLDAGQTNDVILTACAAEEDNWPRPGIHLSKGPLTEIKRALRNGSTPKTTPHHVKEAKTREAKTRMEEIADTMETQSRALNEVQTMTQRAYDLAITLHRLTPERLDAYDALQDPMLKRLLDTFFDALTDAVEAGEAKLDAVRQRASDEAIKRKVAALRNTVGRTPQEAETALRLADRLEKKWRAGLLRPVPPPPDNASPSTPPMEDTA
jgi:hypothetical protein